MKSLKKKIRFTTSDLMGLIGLGGVFYGLYLTAPWVAYTVVGAVLFLQSIIDIEMIKPE